MPPTSVGRAAGGGSESGQGGSGGGVAAAAVVLRQAEEFREESQRHHRRSVVGQILHAGFDEANPDALFRREANDVTQRPLRLKKTSNIIRKPARAFCM